MRLPVEGRAPQGRAPRRMGGSLGRERVRGQAGEREQGAFDRLRRHELVCDHVQLLPAVPRFRDPIPAIGEKGPGILRENDEMARSGGARPRGVGSIGAVCPACPHDRQLHLHSVYEVRRRGLRHELQHAAGNRLSAGESRRRQARIWPDARLLGLVARVAQEALVRGRRRMRDLVEEYVELARFGALLCEGRGRRNVLGRSSEGCKPAGVIDAYDAVRAHAEEGGHSVTPFWEGHALDRPGFSKPQSLDQIISFLDAVTVRIEARGRLLIALYGAKGKEGSWN